MSGCARSSTEPQRYPSNPQEQATVSVETSAAATDSIPDTHRDSSFNTRREANPDPNQRGGVKDALRQTELEKQRLRSPAR